MGQKRFPSVEFLSGTGGLSVKREMGFLGLRQGSVVNGLRRVLMMYTLTGRGGDAIQVLAMSEALRRLGHDVRLVGAQPLCPYTYRSVGGRIRTWAKTLPWWAKDIITAGFHLLACLKAAIVAMRFRPQWILERSTPYGFAGLWLARLFRVPLVAHLDAPIMVERAYSGERIAHSFHRRAMRGLGRHAHLVVIGSEASRTHYAALDIPASKTVLMQNGVFPEDIVPAPSQPNGSMLVGYAGSMSQWHKVDLLIEAVFRLRLSGYPVRLLLVGMGEAYPDLAGLISSRGFADVVEMVGPLPRDETLRVMDRFSVAVLPGTLGTGAPLKLLEYAARGLPIVAPDLANLRQVWGDTTVAYFVPGDPLELERLLRDLLDHPEKRARLARAAWSLVKERYTWTRQMEGVTNALAERVMSATEASA